MNFEERSALVERLAASSKTRPNAYVAGVVAWILLGYAIIAALTITAAGLAVITIAAVVYGRLWFLLKVAWIPLALSWAVARAVFVRLDPPQGRRLARHEAPRLFALVDEIRASLKVPKLAGILLASDMNAAVVETPRFGGLLGWHRHLVLGLPLLIAHSPEELRAILGHELGHLSGRHGRLGAWAYRMRETWSRAAEGIHNQHRALSRPIGRLFDWYVDRLMTATLVLARRQELAADTSAAELTNAHAAARALAWHSVAAELIEERLWKPLWLRVADEPHPTVTPLAYLLQHRSSIFAPPHDEIYESELASRTDTDATHPSLNERLHALGVPRPQIGVSPRSAADEFFPRSFGALVGECDRAWRAAVIEAWNEKHEELATHKRIVDADPATLVSDADHLARAESLEVLGRADEALAIYAEVSRRSPGDARAAFCHGRALIERGDLSGIEHLARAMKHEWRTIAPWCELAYAALRERGLERDADAWAARYREHCELVAAAEAEAGVLKASDDLRPTDLRKSTVDEIVRRCYDAGWVGSVWVLKKQLRALPHSVDVVVVRPKWFRIMTTEKMDRLVEHLAVGPQLTIFSADSGSQIRALNRIPTARVM